MKKKSIFVISFNIFFFSTNTPILWQVRNKEMGPFRVRCGVVGCFFFFLFLFYVSTIFRKNLGSMKPFSSPGERITLFSDRKSAIPSDRHFSTSR